MNRYNPEYQTKVCKEKIRKEYKPRYDAIIADIKKIENTPLTPIGSEKVTGLNFAELKNKRRRLMDSKSPELIKDELTLVNGEFKAYQYLFKNKKTEISALIQGCHHFINQRLTKAVTGNVRPVIVKKDLDPIFKAQGTQFTEKLNAIINPEYIESRADNIDGGFSHDLPGRRMTRKFSEEDIMGSLNYSCYQ